MQPWFIWNGIDSRVMGIWVQQYPPIVRPPERYQEIVIPGRPGALTLLEGEDVYEPYVREMKIMPKPGADIYAILRWLSGSGDIQFGHEPNRVQHARIFDEVSFQKEFASQRSAVIRFLCDPFKRNTYDPESIAVDLTAANYTLQGRGDVIAYPKFELMGAGGCGLVVGGTQIAVTMNTPAEGSEVVEVATIDCETRTVYLTTIEGGVSSVSPLSSHGDFFTLPHDAETVITWSGGLTSLTMWPRWRWF